LYEEKGMKKGNVMKKLFLCFVFFIVLHPFYANAEKILNGRILAINKKFNFVIINLGEKDGIKKGMIFMVYRGQKLLARAETEDVYKEMSSCALIPGRNIGKLKIDDGVLEE